mmetsp:Transcript_31000/g.95754  ORF Transcript_31000/g.95754 Transcript_31000/m.95754 type:complete len:209 (+) Transcript_31000:2433-3059(+)
MIASRDSRSASFSTLVDPSGGASALSEKPVPALPRNASESPVAGSSVREPDGAPIMAWDADTPGLVVDAAAPPAVLLPPDALPLLADADRTGCAGGAAAPSIGDVAATKPAVAGRDPGEVWSDAPSAPAESAMSTQPSSSFTKRFTRLRGSISNSCAEAAKRCGECAARCAMAAMFGDTGRSPSSSSSSISVSDTSPSEAVWRPRWWW